MSGSWSPDPRYQRLEPIGKGGMGEVFRAQDRLTSHWVALKRVHVPRALAPLPASEDTGWKLSLEQAATMASGRAPSPTENASDHEELAPTWNSLPKLSRGLAPPVHPKSEALRLHLTQEFRTLASLRHPHIVSVLDYGFDRDQQPYFTMELLDGALPLDEAARDQPLAVRVALLLQVLQALSYLHRRGIIHRESNLKNLRRENRKIDLTEQLRNRSKHPE